MTKKIYPLGTVVVLPAIFTDTLTGAVLDPSVVMVTIKPPSSAKYTLTYGTDVALVRDSAGNYHANVPASSAGDWTFKWVSTGTGAAASDPAQYLVEADPAELA